MPIKDTQDWVARARALAPMIEAAAGRTEKERKIPADVLSAMHACGLFHMLLPVSLGGGAVDLVTFNQVVEAVAAADASPGWCLAQAAASSHAAGFLDPKVAREVFGAPDALIAWGPPAGVARAIAVDGGYRVTGKWRFASGSANATWMGGHSTVFETADKPRRDAKGNAINRTVLFRRELANIKDTWHVTGLRGTGSCDCSLTLRVRVTPRSSKNDLRLDGESIKVWVTASPTDGQANEAVLALLAKRLDIAKSRLRLVSGQAGRDKAIEIEGMTLEEVRESLG